jgi:LPPG:FO 2-phospho-L-lactate transferase
MIVALAGGVGGARLAHGLQSVLGSDLTVAVNVGDDFDHLGLRICPDLDTVTYTLSGLANPETGWGLVDESWSCLEALDRLGAETWFRLGDRDIATHLARTDRLRQGESLSAITASICGALGVVANVVPVTDESVRTVAITEVGQLEFQDYFVRRQCEPRVSDFRYIGTESARLSSGLAQALASSPVEAFIICPSNPYLSLGPMLAITELHDLLRARTVPAIAVSPIVGGKAIKGPAAKIMEELAVDVSPLGVGKYYDGLIDGLIIDETDSALVDQAANVPFRTAQSVMRTHHDRRSLAEATLAFARDLAR